MTVVQKHERIQMVKAMEYLARCVNDEEVLEGWLMSGVADGDIELGELAVKKEDYENLDYYIQDENFTELMECFLRLMSKARKNGGLFSGGLVGCEYWN